MKDKIIRESVFRFAFAKINYGSYMLQEENLNLSSELCYAIYEFSKKCLTDESISQVERCLLDYLGVCVGGCHANFDHTITYLRQISGEIGFAPVLGSGRKSTKLHCAYLNGLNAHYLELDDGHRFGMLHLGAPIISALIPCLWDSRITRDDFFRSIIVGYEVAIKLSRFMQPDIKTRGFHATGICGTIGAAAAVAVLSKYKIKELSSALAIAATSASGLLAVVDDSELKPHNVGQAAMTGLHAGLIGYLGWKAPEDIFGSERGLFKVLKGSKVGMLDLMNSFFDKRPEIMGVYFKPYGFCRHCHPAIEAAIELGRQIDEAGDIQAIRIYTYKLGIKGHDHKDIRSKHSARMSTPFGVASGLRFKSVNFDSVDLNILNDKVVQGLLSQIEIFEDEALTMSSPEKRSARMEIILADGQVLTAQVDQPKGEPENPMSTKELENKMLMLFSSANRDGGDAIMAVRDRNMLPSELFEMCN